MHLDLYVTHQFCYRFPINPGSVSSFFRKLCQTDKIVLKKLFGRYGRRFTITYLKYHIPIFVLFPRGIFFGEQGQIGMSSVG